MSDFTAAFRIQGRIITALFLRDISSRHGGELKGTLWLLVEPAIIMGVILALHLAYRGAAREVGNASFLLICLTGYVPYVAFRHCAQLGRAAILGGRNLLFHRRIHYLDLIAAKLLAELLAVYLAALLIYAVSLLLEALPLPALLEWVYAGIVVHVWFAVSMCLVLSGLSIMSTVINRLLPVLGLLMMVPYLAFFALNWFPPQYREVLLYFPPANATEAIRYGFVGLGYPRLFDLLYSAGVCLFLTLAGLICMQFARRRPNLNA